MKETDKQKSGKEEISEELVEKVADRPVSLHVCNLVAGGMTLEEALLHTKEV